MLNKDYWNKRYLHNETQWDLGGGSPPIKNWIDQQKGKNINILVPGAGFGHEVIYAYKNGFKNIYYLDYATKAIIKFKKTCPKFPEEQIITQDFFSLTKNYFFDVIIEQTFFCALDPSLRNEYVRKCHQLLRKKGKVIGLLFNTNFNHNGPPYGGETDEYIALFSKMFNLLEMENSIHSVNPRKGNELWIEFEKK
jgi:methyl halide transferase